MQDIVTILSATLSLVLAALLAMAAIHKLTDRERMTLAVAGLTGLPLALAPMALAMAGAVEAAAAVLLLMPESAALGASLAALLWAAYLGFILMAMARGRRSLDCGCSFGKRHAPLGGFAILRNLLLVALGGFVAVVPPHGSPLSDPGTLLAALGFVMLYAAADQVSALSAYRKG